MKRFIRLISAVLILACLASCNGAKTPEENTESETTAETEAPLKQQEPITLIEGGKTQYKLVCSTEADSVTRNAMTQLRQAFQGATGVSIGTSDDYLKAGATHDNDTHKILVGITNYRESIEAYTEMKYNDYLVKLDGTHLLVIAFNEKGFNKAIGWLSDNVFNKVEGTGNNKKLVMDPKGCSGSWSNGVYPVPKWTIAGTDLEKYRFVYSADSNQSKLYTMRRELGEMTGYYLDIVLDTASEAQEYEILFGATNRAESAQVPDPGYLNYVMQVVNNKLVVKTGGEHSTNKILADFVSMFCDSALQVDMEKTFLMQGNYYDDPYNISKPEGTAARVMTCNILGEWVGYGGEDAPISYRKEIFFSMLDYYQPTVIGLQEFSPTWYKVLAEYKDWDKWDVLKFQNPNVGGEYVASTVMYRTDLYELLNSGMRYYSGYNNGRCRCITWAILKDKTSGQEFCFVSTHWDGHISINNENNNVQVQLDELVDFVDMMAEQYPVITTGDFNSNEWTATFKTYLQRIESSDAKYAAQKKVNTIGSWHGLGIDTASSGSCDHITTTNKDTVVLKFEMLMYNEQIWCSDHAWAYADIRFK